MDKTIPHLCIISLLNKAEEKFQRICFTIKVETRALHLSCGYWPGKIILPHSGTRASYSFPGKAGLMGIAVLMERTGSHQASCPAVHTSRVLCGLHPLHTGL